MCWNEPPNQGVLNVTKGCTICFLVVTLSSNSTMQTKVVVFVIQIVFRPVREEEYYDFIEITSAEGSFKVGIVAYTPKKKLEVIFDSMQKHIW